MSSVYQQRLQLLSAGYINHKHIQNIPDDIINHCALWMMEVPQFTINKWYSEDQELPLEIQLSGFAAKILNYNHIGKYEIKCLQNVDEINYNKKHLSKKDQNDIMTHTIFKIYDRNCLAFTKRDAFDIHWEIRSNTLYSIKVIAFDKAESIICESPWQSVLSEHGWLTSEDEYDNEKLDKYFDANIDINNKGFVNVDEWIITMKQTEIVKEATTAKEIFYLICFLSDSEEDIVTRNMFKEFVCVDEYGNYEGKYYSFMESCREKIDFAVEINRHNK